MAGSTKNEEIRVTTLQRYTKLHDTIPMHIGMVSCSVVHLSGVTSPCFFLFGSLYVPLHLEEMIFNPRRTCAARVTVVVVCVTSSGSQF